MDRLPGLVGLLYEGVWDSLSEKEKERIYFANSPELAYREICELRERLETYRTLALEALRLSESTIKDFSPLLEDYKRVSRLAAREERRTSKLDQRNATRMNAQRANTAKKALADFVRKRVKQQPHIAPKELCDEIREKDFVSKNKRGDAYNEGYLLQLVRPLVKQARSDARKGLL